MQSPDASICDILVRIAVSGLQPRNSFRPVSPSVGHGLGKYSAEPHFLPKSLRHRSNPACPASVWSHKHTAPGKCRGPMESVAQVHGKRPSNLIPRSRYRYAGTSENKGMGPLKIRVNHLNPGLIPVRRVIFTCGPQPVLSLPLRTGGEGGSI